MVDFWEVFGRMLTNDEFREDLYHASPDSPYCLGVEDQCLGNHGLEIPGSNYDDVRAVVIGVVTDGPVSLQTLGELLMILSCPDFRDKANDLAAKIQGAVNTSNGSKLFYTAVGCMMLDGQVNSAFANDVFDDIQFGGLTGLERDAIGKLARNGPIKTAAVTACMEFWGTACQDYYFYYPPERGRVDAFTKIEKLRQGRHHLHSIVQVYPPPTCGASEGSKGKKSQGARKKGK